ncbi:MAG: coproporphyrinogen dehydrogenase HemZ [Ruminococcaceae bacterium]|nr:coproporphyrinogen dehydrogenase HemZ [Oscillospiraceae bacterium]
MILHIEGEINRTYCQNLCLIFFPGAKFPEQESPSPTVPCVSIRANEDGGAVTAEAAITLNGHVENGRGSVPLSDTVSRDRAYKRAVGDAVCEAGTRCLGAAPPWGILTGVRPAKVAAELAKEGCDRASVIRRLITEYRVRPDKAELLADVNEAEASTVALAGPGTCSLYVSIPFCPTRCAYCSFVSYATPRYLATLPAYLDRLCEDIRRKGREIAERGETLTSIYVGGGTPTVLDASQLNRLLAVIRESTAFASPLEFTVEAGRPDTVTKEKFEVMLAHGVNRTSINPQILDDTVLRLIGRHHTVEDFYRAYEVARRAGIRSINTDLIAGLPGATEESFCMTMDRIASLVPENVTIHTYAVKRSATFTAEAAERGDKRGIYSFTGGVTGACVDYAQQVLKQNGYRPYYLYRQKNAQGNLENVGFCRPGYEGLYNILIMEELQSIYAVGAGAVTKIVGQGGEKIRRIFEPKYTYEYLSKSEP